MKTIPPSMRMRAPAPAPPPAPVLRRNPNDARNAVVGAAGVCLTWFLWTKCSETTPAQHRALAEQRKAVEQEQRNAARIAEAEASVRLLMRDPESAQFTGAFVYGGAVCGFVNSKNGFGGYAGITRYVTAGVVDATIIESSYGGDFEQLWAESCMGAHRGGKATSGKPPR